MSVRGRRYEDASLSCIGYHIGKFRVQHRFTLKIQGQIGDSGLHGIDDGAEKGRIGFAGWPGKTTVAGWTFTAAKIAPVGRFERDGSRASHVNGTTGYPCQKVGEDDQ
jgi:hypothetical protein